MSWLAAVTDLMLALATGWAGVNLLNRCSTSGGTGGVGLLLVAVAAALGTVRFGFDADLAVAHDGLTRLASNAGVPLVGVAFVSGRFLQEHASRTRSIAFTVLLIGAIVMIDRPWWGQAVGLMGMAGALVGAGATSARVFGLAAAGVGSLCAAAFVVGSTGSMNGIPRVAIFHVVLTIGLLLLARSLFELDRDLVDGSVGA